ncbi:hypothetical protein FALBO_15009 [Fusarium albosuccineum]|uniref:Uncharacterized protein n=1 Tax=Fusarium albosuccineum TaxID=1237068 RepID=A0A8H4KWZ1_9HYPO|nr:hypothetical protein FALBO_15009 [Fusarium albosuccineum]
MAPESDRVQGNLSSPSTWTVTHGLLVPFVLSAATSHHRASLPVSPSPSPATAPTQRPQIDTSPANSIKSPPPPPRYGIVSSHQPPALSLPLPLVSAAAAAAAAPPPPPGQAASPSAALVPGPPDSPCLAWPSNHRPPARNFGLPNLLQVSKPTHPPPRHHQAQGPRPRGQPGHRATRSKISELLKAACTS